MIMATQIIFTKENLKNSEQALLNKIHFILFSKNTCRDELTLLNTLDIKQFKYMNLYKPFEKLTSASNTVWFIY